MSDLVTIILAAGKGTRMKSKLPKVLHKAAGKAMLQHVIDAAREAGADRNIVVTGFGGEMVREAMGEQAGVEYVTRAEQLGTGHAVLQAKEKLEGVRGTVMVLCGDTPLLTGALLKNLYEAHREAKAKATVLTAIMPDATGYGRIIRGEDGSVLISTHLILDVEQVLDEAVFLRQGSVVLHESVDSIRERTNGSVDQLFREMFRTQVWNGGEDNAR